MNPIISQLEALKIKPEKWGRHDIELSSHQKGINCGIDKAIEVVMKNMSLLTCAEKQIDGLCLTTPSGDNSLGDADTRKDSDSETHAVMASPAKTYILPNANYVLPDLLRLDVVMEALEMATDCYNDAALVDKAKRAITAIKQILTEFRHEK